MKTKRCNGKCKLILDLNEFHHSKSSKDGFDGKCKKCAKNYRDENKERNNIKIKKWHKSHKKYLDNYYSKRYEQNKDYYFNYIENNKEKISKYKNVYSNKRYKNDIEFRIRILLRSHLNHALKKENVKKSSSIVKLLGCSIVKFKEYISKQFKPEMNWLNHGEVWELDHIIPSCSYNILEEQEQQKCFHYTNYQPLFKTTEIAKKFGYNENGNRNKAGKII